MKLVIFGLSVSSAWGNGHATFWRALIRALARRGHEVVFLERDLPDHAAHRDLYELSDAHLVIYRDWREALPQVRRHLGDADVAMVTSRCPDGLAATGMVLESRARVRVFYDLDTPITLRKAAEREPAFYLGPRGLGDFDLVLSFTGGEALDALRGRLGARAVAPLYGAVDPEAHRPVPPTPEYMADVSYLGVCTEDRREGLERLLIEPARRLPERRFLVGGARCPDGAHWPANMAFAGYVPPAEYPAFHCSSRLALNVTRPAMAESGYCPSVRLFEAAACGVAMLSDGWEGLDTFFEPGSEILIARTVDDVEQAVAMDDAQLERVGQAARRRALEEHTADRRAREMIDALDTAAAATAGRPGG